MGIDIEEVKSLIQRSSYAEGLTSDTRRRSKVYEALARSDDPLTREIGLQLRSGQMRPGDIFQVESYREHFNVDTERDQRKFGQAVSAAKDHLSARVDAEEGNRR